MNGKMIPMDMFDKTLNTIIPKEVTLGQHFHLSVSLSGLLQMNKNALWKEWGLFILDNNKKPYRDADHLIEAIKNLMAKGVEKIPGGDCDNFDVKKGCLGHQTKLKEADHETQIKYILSKLHVMKNIAELGFSVTTNISDLIKELEE